jgi:2-polyprenyl-3-methyl-5-hydroxy-6-metoxy-1,4-benzoquinol methylase
MDVKHDTIYGPFRMDRDYFSGVPTRDLQFALLRCNRCGVVSTHPCISDKDLDYYYNLGYNAHDQLTRSMNGTSSVLLRLRETFTKKFAGLFFSNRSRMGGIRRRLLASPLFPRTFRGYPLLVEKPQSLLDIGCGDGSFLRQLSDTPCNGFGIDISPVAVENARLAGLNVRLGNMEDDRIPVDGERYDVVRMVDFLEHTAHPGTVLKKTCELLAPGGELIVCVPNFAALSRKIFGVHWPALHLPFHRHFFDRPSLLSALRTRGLSVELAFTKNTLQWLYGLDYVLSLRIKNFVLVSLLTRILCTPFDIMLDIMLPNGGDSIEVHARKKV